jgi:predicted DNA-binding WGR domain protein
MLLLSRPAPRRATVLKAHPVLQPAPTPAQAEAGNYPKDRLAWNGLTLVIENPAGSLRCGTGWETRMLFDYGYVARSEAMDGDEVDVYIGPALETAPLVFIVHQRQCGNWDEYDEDKCMLGFLSEEEATIAYLKHYDDARFLGPVTAMPVAEFVAKVKATREEPAVIKSLLRVGSLFIDADLLKAGGTLKKMITVPGYTKKDGTVVPPHQKMVHYNDEHLFADVAAGGVSHSQKQAHAKLSKEDWFHQLPFPEKALHVMSHATDIQDAASASAAVSGWKAAAKAGKNPTGAQWAAFSALPKHKQAGLYDEVKAAAGSWSHLKDPKSQGVVDTIGASWEANEAKDKAKAAAKGEAVDPGLKLYHYGNHADSSSLQPLTFFTSDKKAAQSYASNSPGGVLHEVTLNLKNAANDAQVLAAAKKVGVDVAEVAGYGDPDDVSGFEALSPHLDAESAKKVMAELKKQGFDGAHFKTDFALDGGLLPDGSWVIFSPEQVVPSSESMSPEQRAMIEDDAKKGNKVGLQVLADEATTGNAAVAAYAQKKLDAMKPAGAAQKLWAQMDGEATKAHAEKASARLAQIESGGSFYQKKALAQLKTEDAFGNLSPGEQYEHVMELYKKLQGAASASAAVSGWKKAMLAGKVPSPAQQKAFNEMGAASPEKAGAMMKEITHHIGDLLYVTLKDQANAALGAPKSVAAKQPPAPPVIDGSSTFSGVVNLITVALEEKDPHGVIAQLGLLHGLNSDAAKQAKDYGKAALAHLGVPLPQVLEENAPAPAPVAENQKLTIAGLPLGWTFTQFDPGFSGVNSATVEHQGNTYFMVPTDGGAFQVGIIDADGQPTKYEDFNDAGSAASWLNTELHDIWTPGAFHLIGSSSLLGDGLYGHTPPKPLTLDDELNEIMQLHGLLGGKNTAALMDKAKASDAAGLKALMDALPASKKKTKAFAQALLDKIGGAPPEPQSRAPSAAPAQASTKSTTFTAPKKTYHNTEDNHYKEWSFHVAGNQLITEYGKIGGTQQKTVKTFPDSASAHDAGQKLAFEKTQKGYVHQGTDYGHQVTMGTPVSLGPQDGDTKPGANGTTLVFKDGHWHAQPTAALGTGKITKLKVSQASDIVKQATQGKKLGGAWSAMVTKAKKLAVAGDVAGLIDMWTKVKDLPHAPATKAAISALLQATSGAPVSSSVPVKPAHLGGSLIGKVADDMEAALLAGNAKLIEDQLVSIDGLSSASAIEVKKFGVSAMKHLGAKQPGWMTTHMWNGGAAPAPAPAPKASPPSPAPAAPAATVKPKSAAHKPGDPAAMDAWPQTGPQKGSNPGGKFKDPHGQEWYCKFPGDENVARNEFLAAKFYQMLGVPVPTLKLVTKGGKLGIASKWADGLKKVDASALSAAKGVHENFAIDAWLGNWDVVGASNDNLLLGPKGPVRVDAGGSLIFRAQGGKKSDFGKTVPELDTMLNASKNPKAAAVFAGIQSDSLRMGVRQLNKLKPSQIQELVDKIGPGTKAEKDALASTLIARRKFILDKFKIPDQWEQQKALDPTKLPVNPADLPKPIDFQAMNSGKGLSSKAHVNAQNKKDSEALLAFALKGNLVALKDYKYDAVDKESGAALGKKSIVDHPSSHLKEQWAALVELLQSIASPAIPTLDMPSIGAAGSLEEISDFVGTFAPTDRVETVPTEHRMHFFMALGQIDDVHDLITGIKWHFHDTAGPWVKAMKSKFGAISSHVKAYIHAVQDSGWVNHIWAQGKKTIDVNSHGFNYSGGIQALTKKIYDEAAELPEGTVLRRGMTDSSAGKSMTKQLLAAKPGLVIQNTDSMCASYYETHSWGGDIEMTIRCPKGCKATPSFASGRFGGEHEVTTLPGQRYVVLSVKPKASGKGVQLEVLMLPPHEGYVAELGKLAAVGKALQSVMMFFRKVF